MLLESPHNCQLRTYRNVVLCCTWASFGLFTGVTRHIEKSNSRLSIVCLFSQMIKSCRSPADLTCIRCGVKLNSTRWQVVKWESVNRRGYLVKTRFALWGAALGTGLLLILFIVPSVSVATSDQSPPKQVPTVPPRTPVSQPTTVFPLSTPSAACVWWGDINKDNCVNIFDLVIISRWYGRRGSGMPVDVNADGVIDIYDLVIVTTCFSKCR